MSELSREDLVQVAERLLAKTEAGQQDWGVLRNDSEQFSTSSPGFNFYIRTRDGDGVAPYVLEVWKRGGPTSSVQVAELETEPGFSANEVISDLWREARSSALGLRTLREDLFKDLE